VLYGLCVFVSSETGNLIFVYCKVVHYVNVFDCWLQLLGLHLKGSFEALKLCFSVAGFLSSYVLYGKRAENLHWHAFGGLLFECCIIGYES
jgi:hypothetical protein